MTKYQFKNRWKVVPCKAMGVKCWCRTIRTENGRSEIVFAGMMSKQQVEYFVKLHNASLDKP